MSRALPKFSQLLLPRFLYAWRNWHNFSHPPPWRSNGRPPVPIILSKRCVPNCSAPRRISSCPGQQKPFFIEYRLVDLDVRTITASFGALVSSTTTHNRFMDVGIRIGDYKIDNSNFISGDESQGFLGSSGRSRRRWRL